MVTNLGMRRLRKAALDFECDRACLACGSDDLKTLDRGLECDGDLQGYVKCRSCGAVERGEDSRNYMREALAIYDGRSLFIAGKEHISALVGHAEELHLRIAELEEVLAAERARIAVARNEEPVYA